MIRKIIDYIKEPYLKIIYYQNSINIINYDEIIEIKDNFIKIKTKDNNIYIYGNNLKLNKLLDNEILITGTINKIEL